MADSWRGVLLVDGVKPEYDKVDLRQSGSRMTLMVYADDSVRREIQGEHHFKLVLLNEDTEVEHVVFDERTEGKGGVNRVLVDGAIQ